MYMNFLTYTQAAQEAMSKLQSFTMKKMKVLLSTEVELRRQLEQIEGAESYLDKARKKKKSSVTFLRTWKNHTEFRSQICHQTVEETKVLDSIEPDLDVEGKIEVVALSSSNSSKGEDGERTRTRTCSSSSASGFLLDGLLAANTFSGTTIGQSNAKFLPLPPDLVAKLSIAGAPYALNGRTPPNTMSSSAFNATGDLDNSTSSFNSISPPPSSLLSNVSFTTPRTRIPAELLPLARHYSQYSLKAIAERKGHQLKAINPRRSDFFQHSAILTSPLDAATLYYSLPFITSVPATSLIYSSQHHDANVKTLQAALLGTFSATIIIIKSGDFVFGGKSLEVFSAAFPSVYDPCLLCLTESHRICV